MKVKIIKAPTNNIEETQYNVFAKGGNLSREEDYGSAKKPYPSVAKGDFAGGGRSYPIPTKADAIDALRLAGLHSRSDVRSKVYAKYPSLKKDEGGELFADGGGLFNTNKTQYVDSVLTANKNKEWVQRLTQPQTVANSIKDPYNPKYRSTHLMADDGNGYVYPTIIKQEGKLIHFPTAFGLNEDQAIEYAKKNGIGIQLPKKEGTWFANNGYKLGTKVNNNVDSKTGIPFHDPKFKLNKYAQGGDLEEQEQNGINSFATGGTHEQNPNGGIPQGVDGEGTPNLVEQGEVKYDNYIFSNRLKVDKKHTFADMAKKYSRESKERPNDPISKRGLDTKMNALRGIQELMKGTDSTSQQQESQPFAKGGTLPPSLGQQQKWDRLLTPALTTPSYSDVPTVPNVINPSLSGPSIQQKGSEIAQRIREAPLQTFTTDNQPSDLSLASLRYAPAVGAGLATLTDTLGLTNRPDYTAAKRIGSLSVTPRMLGNYQKYTPMDKNYYTNELLSNAAAARAGLESSSGGNRAAYTSAVTGLNYGTGKSLGELARQSEEENIQRRQQVMAYNQGIDQYNAQQAAQAQLTNNQYRAQAAQLAEQADIMSKQTKMANLNNFLQTLGDIGGEETRLNIAKSNPALYDYLTRTGEVKYKGLVKRCGGKLKFK